MRLIDASPTCQVNEAYESYVRVNTYVNGRAPDDVDAQENSPAAKSPFLRINIASQGWKHLVIVTQ